MKQTILQYAVPALYAAALLGILLHIITRSPIAGYVGYGLLIVSSAWAIIRQIRLKTKRNS